MDKRDKIDFILGLVKEQTDEFLESEEITGLDMSAEELIIAAIELLTNLEVTGIEYTSPLGIVDRENVSFMVDEEFDVPIWGNYDED